MKNLLAINWNGIVSTLWNWIKTDGIKLVLALIVLFMCFKLTNLIFKKINKSLEKRKTDKTLSKVFVSIGRKVVKAFLLIIFISYVGIDTSSIVGAITAGAVTVGLALQGTLSNLAAGVLIIVLRSFRVGDFIDCSGESGTVDEIGLFQTKLITTDNKTVIIPNSNALNGVVVNYSLKDTRRVDMEFSIAYENDFRKAKAIIYEEIEKTKLALNEPNPFVNIKTHNSSSIDIVVRVWVKSADYWNFYWMMMESIKLAFDKNGISIPYTQMDVHMKDDSKLPNPIDEQDDYVKEEIEHYHLRRQAMYDSKKQREEELAEEQEKKANKNIVKYLSKKAKQKKNSK
ncbi:MAG: mechanosensitive ion channel [Clostridiales bacterium]|nr:mechanosensitive ion channel [Clostridiales bacterium]